MPASTNTRIMVRDTLTPDTLAASSLEPTANIFFPKVVLFQTIHITAVSTMAYSTYLGTATLPILNRVPVTRERYPSVSPLSVWPLLVPFFRYMRITP